MKQIVTQTITSNAGDAAGHHHESNELIMLSFLFLFRHPRVESVMKMREKMPKSTRIRFSAFTQIEALYSIRKLFKGFLVEFFKSVEINAREKRSTYFKELDEEKLIKIHHVRKLYKISKDQVCKQMIRRT